jgi:DNA polymerase
MGRLLMLERAPPPSRSLDALREAARGGRACPLWEQAVKHFKFVPRGKRWLHEKPSAREVAACKPWLDAELAALKPSPHSRNDRRRLA